jgi:hypothetical protein
MEISELNKILAAVILLSVIWGISPLIKGQPMIIISIIVFSFIVISFAIFSKKIMAHLLDADVEHDIWRFQRFWFFPGSKLPNPVPMGIILPIFFSIFSIGLVKLSAILTFQTRAKKSRKARRFGYYSFAEMTDWHNGIIGASGIISVIILGIIAYFLPIPNQELLSKMAIYYAFWNLFPISDLDGTQIFFGSRTLWAVLAAITVILTALVLTI